MFVLAVVQPDTDRIAFRSSIDIISTRRQCDRFFGVHGDLGHTVLSIVLEKRHPGHRGECHIGVIRQFKIILIDRVHSQRICFSVQHEKFLALIQQSDSEGIIRIFQIVLAVGVFHFDIVSTSLQIHRFRSYTGSHRGNLNKGRCDPVNGCAVSLVVVIRPVNGHLDAFFQFAADHERIFAADPHIERDLYGIAGFRINFFPETKTFIVDIQHKPVCRIRAADPIRNGDHIFRGGNIGTIDRRSGCRSFCIHICGSHHDIIGIVCFLDKRGVRIDPQLEIRFHPLVCVEIFCNQIIFHIIRRRDLHGVSQRSVRIERDRFHSLHF